MQVTYHRYASLSTNQATVAAPVTSCPPCRVCARETGQCSHTERREDSQAQVWDSYHVS